jgi:hypothetical protein
MRILGVTLPQQPPSGLLGTINQFRHFERPSEPNGLAGKQRIPLFAVQGAFLIYARPGM